MVKLKLTLKRIEDGLIEDRIFLKETISEAMQFVREYSTDKYKIIDKPVIEEIAA